MPTQLEERNQVAGSVCFFDELRIARRVILNAPLRPIGPLDQGEVPVRQPMERSDARVRNRAQAVDHLMKLAGLTV